MKVKYSIYLSVILTITAMVLNPAVIYAQEEEPETECVRKLAKAQKAYEEGLIEKVEGMISSCLEGSQMTKEEQLQAYKLLIMAKLYDDKKADAEQAMLAFLKIEPEYTVQPGVDPKEFAEMFSHYHTSPLYTIGIYLGGNVSQINPSEERGGYNTADDKKQYTNRFGFQLGFKISRYIHKGLNVNFEPGFMQNGVRYTHEILDSYTTVDRSDEGPRNSTRGSLNESVEVQSLINLPINFSYTFFRDKTLRPFVMLGGGMRYMLSSQVTNTKTYIDPSIASVETTNQDLKLERNRMTFNAMIGAGVKYKIPKGEIFLDARYSLGLSQQVKRDAVELNSDATFWNHYESDNLFKMDILSISVGYSYYLFKPRKMKDKKVKEL